MSVNLPTRIIRHLLASFRGQELNRYLYIFMHVPKCAGTTINKHIDANFEEEQILKLIHQRILTYVHDCDSMTYENIANVCQNLTTQNPIVQKAWIKNLIEALPQSRKDSIQVIYGHWAYYGIHEFFAREPRYFVFVRNPISRLISHYCYHCSRSDQGQKFFKVRDAQGKQIPFEQWLTAHPFVSNHMTWFLAERFTGDSFNNKYGIASPQDLEHAKMLLDRLYFVGLTENPKDMDFIYNRLGIQRYVPAQNVSIKSYVTQDADQLRELILSYNQLDFDLYKYAVKLNSELIIKLQGYHWASLHTGLMHMLSKV